MHTFDTTLQLATMRRDELVQTAARSRAARTPTIRSIARRARRSLAGRMS